MPRFGINAGFYTAGNEQCAGLRRARNSIGNYVGRRPVYTRRTGRNYGIEVTLEKFFDQNYYFLLTTSLFDSKYKGLDGIERHTKFASNYAFNFLAGYEWRIGARNLLSVNTRLSHVGGKRYVPISLDTIENEFIHDYTHAYVNRLPDYFRADLTINLKQNFSRRSTEWFVEINNITNHKNIWFKYFDVNRNREELIYQYGLMPIGGFRFYF
jgi:hypothetical protein